MIDVRYLWYLRSATRARTCSTTNKRCRSTTSSVDAEIRTTLGQTFGYDEAALAHQQMGEGRFPRGTWRCW